MKFILKSNIDFGGPFREGWIELKGEKVTLKSLLNEISERCSFKFFDPKSGEIASYIYGLSVNGCEYLRLPNGLDTELENGIEVEVNLSMLGGG